MSMRPDEGTMRGQGSRDDGMERAARRKEWMIRRGELAFLDAMMSRSDRMATTDDATNDLGHRYDDGGRWRGSIPKRLAADRLIEAVGAVRSARPSRHKGLLTKWRGVDDAAIERKRLELQQWLEQHPFPQDGGEQLGLFKSTRPDKPNGGTRWACI